MLFSYTWPSFVLSTDSWFLEEDPPVFQPQDNVAKVCSVSLKFQTHLRGWMDFKSNLSGPESWSEMLNGDEFYMDSTFIESVSSGSRGTVSPKEL